MERFGIRRRACRRLPVYNTKEEVDALVKESARLHEVFA